MPDTIENDQTTDEVEQPREEEIPEDGVPLNPDDESAPDPDDVDEPGEDATPVAATPTPATTPVTPPKRQPVQPAEPDLKEFDQIQTLGDELDTELDAGGKLKNFAGTVTKLVKSLAKENHDLKQQVGQQGDVIGSVAYGKRHDADPANANYPWVQAEKDLEAIKAQVSTDPEYADKGPDLQDWIAHDRFKAHKASKAVKAETPAPTPTGLPPVRKVGATRTIPRQSRQAPVPARAPRKVNDMLKDGELPGGKATERALAEFGN